MASLLYAVFALSGLVGLIYETIWSRYLGLFVGHSAYAQVIVLVIFLGGMSFGAAVAGRLSARLQNPLLWYAIVEVIVGLIGLAFDSVFAAATDFSYASVFPALGGGVVATAYKWTLASLLILPQSILLGTTFPLMSVGSLRKLGVPTSGSGRVLGLLYFSNSIGAAGGGLVAGFFLIAAAGLPGTLVVAAIGNFAVALVVFLIARGTRAVTLSAPAAESAQDVPKESADAAVTRRRLLWVAGGTAVASFIYEIAWIRMLSLVLGGATHSFELMLSAFILGLALGSFWVRSKADRFADPIGALGVTQVVMGVLAVATMPLYLASFSWMGALLPALAPTDGGYVLFTIVKYGLALAVMLPATFCAGITLPLITRTLLVGGAGERVVGTVYAVNTLGSIVGAALAALVLMPILGLKGLLIAGALVDIGFGLFLLRGIGQATDAGVRRFAMLSVGAFAALVVVAASARFDRQLLTSGVYRYGAERMADSELLYYEDGRTATVSARRTLRDGSRSISTNGKPDASLPQSWLAPRTAGAPAQPLLGDQGAQILLPTLSLAYAPHARRAAVIGQGSGMSSHLLLGSPTIEMVTTIEIEPRMIDGSRVFMPANRRVFEDPRSQIVIDDARSVFASGRERYDLIVSEPSNPWVSGVSGLFTDEFYRRVRDSLNDGGVLGQWIHIYETNDPLVLSVLGAIRRNFSSFELHMASAADILIVARKGGAPAPPDWASTRRSGIAEDLSRVTPISDRAFDGTWMASSEVFDALLARWPGVNSDYFPVLDLGTERARFRKSIASGIYGLASDRFSIVRAMLGRRLDFADFKVPSMEVPAVASAALGQRMRPVWEQSVSITPDLTHDAALRGPLFGARHLQALSLSRAAPGDWKEWVSRVAEVDSALHTGTAGVGEAAFFSLVEGYVAETQAPPEAISAVRFLNGVAHWNWPLVDAAFPALLAKARAGENWLDPQLLRAGGVVAKLKLGKPDEARTIFDELTIRAQIDPLDLRSLLLDSWIRSAASGAPSRAQN